MLEDEDAVGFLGMVQDMLSFLLPRFRSEGKSYVTIGVGCTGGRHRSVAIAEEIGRWLEAEGIEATIRHRDAAR